MEPLIVYIAASLSVVALFLSVAALAIHWVRRSEHPDITPVSGKVNELHGQLLELWDKFDHQVRRDRTRRLRAAKETPTGEDEGGGQLPLPSISDEKTELRRRAWNMRTGTRE